MLKFLLNLFFISFLLNFVWEITQMPLYGEIGMGIRGNYSEFLKIHWEVSLKDALMVAVVYLVIGFLLRNWEWPKNFNKGWVLLWLALPIWQGIIEYYSVYVNHRWAYTESMPLILGIGFSSILQMLTLPTAAILLSKKSFD